MEKDWSRVGSSRLKVFRGANINTTFKDTAVRFLVSLGLLIALLPSPGCLSSSPPRKIAWRTLSRGLTSGIEDARRVVIRDEATYLRLWAEHAADANRVALPPAVDFDREMVIFVSMGSRPTGGFIIEIVDVELRRRKLRVLVSEQDPAPGTMQIQRTTQPYQLIALPTMRANVTFRTVQQSRPNNDRRKARPGEEGSSQRTPLRAPPAPLESPRGAANSER